jgi:aspartyl-tRNA(Asn)/glutamyl-tRNA(Gln) amidotransferase subunit A
VPNKQGELFQKMENIQYDVTVKTRILRLLNTYSHSAVVAEPGHDPTVLSETREVVKELLEKADEKTKKVVLDYAEKLKANGVKVEEISLDFFDIANTAWQILYTAETCNNVSRYDGVKYGFRAQEYKNIDELYVNSRTEGFNFLTKAVILYGSDVLSKNRYDDCYGKALKVRRIIAENMAKLFENFDAVLTPVCSKTEFNAYGIDEAFIKVFGEGVFTCVANLVGIPALSCGGVQLMGNHFAESTLLSLAGAVERMGE